MASLGKCKMYRYPNTVFEVTNYRNGIVALEYHSGNLEGEWMLSHSCDVKETNFSVPDSSPKVKYNHPDLKVPTRYSEPYNDDQDDEYEEQIIKKVKKKKEIKEEDKDFDYFLNILKS